MKIGLRGGHNPFVKGAMGLIDEQVNVRELSNRLKPVLEKYGHIVVDCNSNARTVSGNLREGTDKANSNNCNIYISLHMNAFNGIARGVESLVNSSSSPTAITIGNRVCSNLSSLGLPNRGIKYRPELHDLKATKMPAIIIEILFCDNRQDVDIWNKNTWDTFVYLIANAIDPKIPKVKPVNNSGNTLKETFYRVICGSFKDRVNAENRVKELEKNGFNELFIEYYKEKGFFRVVCGSFKNRVNAAARIKELSSKGFRDGFIDIFMK